jgi:hypothetical protein
MTGALAICSPGLARQYRIPHPHSSGGGSVSHGDAIKFPKSSTAQHHDSKSDGRKNSILEMTSAVIVLLLHHDGTISCQFSSKVAHSGY